MRRSLILVFSLLLSMLLPASAHGAITWSITSDTDTVYDGDIYNSKYDVEDVSAAIFDNDPDEINFYMDFLQVPTTQMFNDGLGSWAYIGLDYDLDGKRDIMLILDRVTLKSDLTGVAGRAWNANNKVNLNCDVSFFTNIDERKSWIGVQVSRKCLSLPLRFGLFAYAEYNSSAYKNTNLGSWDYAPYPDLRVDLPGSTSVTQGTSAAATGSTYAFPQNVSNSSTDSKNFSAAPANLSSLSDSLLPSVVTVKCASGSGTGWSADVALSQPLKDAGFQSFIITNHHVIEDCLTSKSVNIVLSNGSTVAGQVVSWNRTSDVAGVVTKNQIPTMQWIGSSPKQGWWVGVLGSPLGKSNVLTTGIISSVNQNTKVFTLTAAINPGNSGGPVFDNTGRVLGLATSKAVLSDGQLAEGFGNAHGVPLLCGTVITCQAEPDPWNAKSKFAAGPTPEEIARLEAEAKAKAEAEAKAKAEAEAKAKAEEEARVKLEAEAKAKADAEARLREELRNKCIKLNGDIDVAVFNAKNGQSMFPSSSKAFGALVLNAPPPLACDAINLATFDAELQSRQKLVTTYEVAVTAAITSAQATAKKKVTITCVKGSVSKKVSGINPKCPPGYRKK